MKKVVVSAFALTLTAMATTSFASGKSTEESCRAAAQRHHIAANKMDSYVKHCLEHNSKSDKKGDASNKTETNTKK